MLRIFQAHDPEEKRGIYLPSPQAAAYAATACAQVSGEPAVVEIPAEPESLLLAASGLYPAWADRLPVILLVQGEIPEELIPLLRSVTRSLYRYEDPPPPSPDPYPACLYGTFSSPDPQEGSLPLPQKAANHKAWEREGEIRLKELTQALAQAKRPVILAGGGALPFLPQLLTLASRSRIPMLLTARATTMDLPTLSFLASQPPDIPLIPSGNLVWTRSFMSADLILALGTALSEIDGFGLQEVKAYRAPLFHIGRELPEASKSLCALHLPGELAPLLNGPLEKVLGEPTPARESWCKRLAGWEQRWKGILAEAAVALKKKEELDPFLAAYLLVQNAPPRTIFVSEGGACGMQMWANLWLRPFLFPCQTGCIGVTLPFSLGACAFAPDCPVWNVLGDGAFFFYPELLSLFARRRHPIVTFLFNDASYGAIRLGQTFFFGGRYIGTDLPAPEFALIARELGCLAHRVDYPQELVELLPELARIEHPVLVDLRILKDALPLAGANFVLAEFDGALRASAGRLLASSIKALLKGKVPFPTLRMGRRMMVP